MSNLTFSVLPAGAYVPEAARSRAFLITDNWDDWFEYSTQYSLVLKDESGSRHDIGQVKIGQFQMVEGQRRPEIPNDFEKLDERFFSLGQDDSYYEALNGLSGQLREEILSGLRDIAANPDIWEKACVEKVTQVSLLRGVSTSTVVGQLKPYSDEGKSDQAPKNLEALTGDFADSMKTCRQGARANRWRRALEMLGSDPIFKEAELAALADSEDTSGIFGKLSSGHKIVLLIITRLVETVEERTLVLIDEPEAHLHPPLLSAFVRALSDLLINRNGVAIVATHSPVMLQEVPKCCAWKLRRNGRVVNAERPEIETFGENVGVLTREIFGLEVTHSGFHKLLGEEVDRGNPFEIIVGRFNDQLGAEARAIVRALIAEKESRQKQE